MRRDLAPIVLALALLAAPMTATEHWLDDLTVDLSSMTIDRVELDGREISTDFYRNNVELSAGVGRSTFGLVYQSATKGVGTAAGTEERGLMLTVGHDHRLSASWRLDLRGRIGLTGADESQPLYAEDTDARANLVWFDSDGIGPWAGRPAFPSGYVGTVVNRFGRVQLLGGVGVWWRGVGGYLTAFHALNGDRPIFDGVDYGALNFANLENAGYSLTLSYDWRNLAFRIKRNFPIQNGSDDLTLGVAFRHYPGRTPSR